jgi:hypothetical protein
MSTTAWSPAVGTSAGDAITSAVATAAAASSYCNPVTTAVSRSGSPVAAALAAAHATLDERRLVSTGTPDMSALTGARVGTIVVTLRTRKHKDEHQPLKIQGARGGSAAHLNLEKPCFLFLEGSEGAAVVPAGAAVALAGTFAVLAGSSTDDPVAGASAPATGACSTAASAARGDRGRGFHLSGGPAPRRSPLPPPPLTMSSPVSLGGESLLLAQPVLLVV